jgi:PKD repeat protein
LRALWKLAMIAALGLVAAPLVFAAPPAADFTIDPSSPEVDQPVTFTSSVFDADGDGSEGGIQWDFDYTGSFTEDATGPSASTSYPSAGPRTVAMRVTDGVANDNTADTVLVTKAVNVTPPPPAANQPAIAEFTISPNPASVNRDVTFDGSASSDPDGPEPFVDTNYDWDLDGNGSFETSGRIVTRKFETPGTRTIRLQVTDQNGTPSAVAEELLTVNNAAPTNVDFTWQPEGKPVGAAADLDRPVAFSASATDPEGQALAYAWDFGDGTPPVTGQNPTHTFRSAGNKSVRLTVSDPHTSVPVREKTVPVNRPLNAPPQASFIVAPDNAFVGDTVTLSSSSADPDGPLARQEWDLDNDGQFDDAIGAVVTTRFDNPGVYPLKLRVSDSRGATATAEGRVNVHNRPTPPTPLLSGVDIELRALVFRTHTRVRWLRVRAPAGSKVTVRCRGKRCPKQVAKTSKGRKILYFKRFHRRLRPRTKLVVTVTKSGFIGKQTRWTMRRRKLPLKRNLCLPPGATKASRCPEQ